MWIIYFFHNWSLSLNFFLMIPSVFLPMSYSPFHPNPREINPISQTDLSPTASRELNPVPSNNINVMHPPPSRNALNVQRRVPPYQNHISSSPLTFLLFCIFIGVNITILALIFVAWIHFYNYVRKNTGGDYIYGLTTALPCASRMLNWMHALFGLSVASKLALLWILFVEILETYVIRRASIVMECMIFTSLVFKMMIPFGFGFKLFWYENWHVIRINKIKLFFRHLCGTVVLADSR